MESGKSYFFSSFLIVLLSAVFFLGIKRVLPEKIFSEAKAPTKNVLIDSMLIDAFEAAKENPTAKKTVAETGEPMEDQPVISVATNGVRFPDENTASYKGFQNLVTFYEKLYQLQTTGKGNVRIAYYGDSMTDGDMIVQDFRGDFQDKFGGEGVGFVSITSESAASRNSIKHDYSKNWKMQSYLNVRHPRSPFGVNGHVFFANDTVKPARISFGIGRGKHNKTLGNATLFFGKSGNKEGYVSYIKGKDTIRKKLDASQKLNTINLASGSKFLGLEFHHAQQVPVYGFNFDNGNGVHVDNFSQRGNSGIPLSAFDVPLMNAFQQKLGYDLVILHYGTNVLNYGTLDYTWYQKAMAKAVARVRECFPGAAILIVSTADKATKYGTEMKTDSAVVPLVNAQKRLSINNRTGFANLYELMGGSGSMVHWVEDEPALAGKDYTHPNFKGSRKIASLLFNQLMEGYAQFQKLRQPTAPAKPADSLKENQPETTDE